MKCELKISEISSETRTRGRTRRSACARDSAREYIVAARTATSFEKRGAVNIIVNEVAREPQWRTHAVTAVRAITVRNDTVQNHHMHIHIQIQ